MLEKYKKVENVYHVGTNNFQPGYRQRKNSYYFSKYSHIWGWGSWRRAWKHYDVNMKSWPEIKRKGSLNKFWNSFWEKQYWQTIFDATYSGKINTWDYQWLYTTWINSAFSISPGVNLVQNIGFNKDSTHTTVRSKSLELKAKEMVFPLSYPKKLIRKQEFDNYETKNNYHAEPITVMALKIKFFLEKFL
jgi:hypothetical protein